MTSDITPAVADDTPALAGAIVLHAKNVCETADHLWRVLGDVSIPTEGLTDTRQQRKVTFGTEPMARVYIYQTIYDLAQSEVADRLGDRPALLKQLGLSKVPTQQNLSYAWGQFSAQTKRTLDAAAKGIALEARNHNVISDALVPIDLDEDSSDDEEKDSPVSRAPPAARALDGAPTDGRRPGIHARHPLLRNYCERSGVESQRSAETISYILRRFQVVTSEPVLVESNI